MRYRDSGVDIDRANDIVRGIARLAPPTWGPRVLSRIGNFGGLFDARDLGDSPVLVCSIDGVGTKTQVATRAQRYRGLGEDIVNHSVNDILVQGARPLLFLDYLAASQLDAGVVLEIVDGMASACAAHACALLGGETAEMPGTYTTGDYDVVGCIVGVAERPHMLTGSDVHVGDEIWGMPSNGLHTNGFSLARRVLLEEAGLALDSVPEGLDGTLAEALLAPHRSYFEPLWPLLEERVVHALVHITGGGFPDNIPRVLPEGCAVEIDPRAWTIPALFGLIQRLGDVPHDEMRRVFNLGLGMLVILDAKDADRLRQRCPEARRVGRVVEGGGTVHFLD